MGILRNVLGVSLLAAAGTFVFDLVWVGISRGLSLPQLLAPGNVGFILALAIEYVLIALLAGALLAVAKRILRHSQLSRLFIGFINGVIAVVVLWVTTALPWLSLGMFSSGFAAWVFGAFVFGLSLIERTAQSSTKE